MKQYMESHLQETHTEGTTNSDTQSRTLLTFGAISFLCHVAVIGTLTFLPEFGHSRRFVPAAINVRMVSLPAEEPGAEPAAAPAVEKKLEIEKKPEVQQEPEVVFEPEIETPPVPPKPEPKPVRLPEPEVEPKKKVSLSPKKKPKEKIKEKPEEKKVKTSLKKKSFQSPRKARKKVVRNVEKKHAEKARSKQISSALARLKKKVATQGGGGGAGAGGIPGGRGGLGPAVLTQIQIYQTEVAYQIQKNWAFSEQFAGGPSNLEAILVIKILPSGKISDIWFDKRSGNSYLDESAFKAVKKSNPLPRLPNGYVRPYYNLGLRFTPSGVG